MKKKTISILLILTLVFGSTTAVFAAPELDFSAWDSGGHYPADVRGTLLFTPVRNLIDRGILTGDADGLFHPARSVNRAEFATMMARATNSFDAVEINALQNMEIFTDLEGHRWATHYINAAVRAGLFTGRSEDRFAPTDNVTYAEVITVIIRMNTGTAGIAGIAETRWPDNYIRFAQTYNMTGTVQVRDWNAPATRGDVATILHRALPNTRACTCVTPSTRRCECVSPSEQRCGCPTP